MDFLFFESGDAQLFGALHPANMKLSHGMGVVMCYPWGQEYMRVHRGYCRLAEMLSSRGFDVLRFDYRGCGDSSGDHSGASVAAWVQDVKTATERLRMCTGVQNICLFGVRLGATIAMLAATALGGGCRLVLWNPVLKGREYLAEVRDRHNRWQRGSFSFRCRRDMSMLGTEEVLGYELTTVVREELEGLDMLGQAITGLGDVLIVDTAATAETTALLSFLGKDQREACLKKFPTKSFWYKDQEDMSGSVVPLDVLTSIADWLQSKC